VVYGILQKKNKVKTKKVLFCLNHSKKRQSYWLIATKKNKDFKVKTIYTWHDRNRANFLEKIFEKFGFPIDLDNFNKRLLNEVEKKKYDYLFIEKCLYLKDSVLNKIKNQKLCDKLIFFSNDNMLLSHNSYYFNQSLLNNYYNKIILTKDPNYVGLEKKTKSKINYLDKSYCKYTHLITKKFKKKYDILFIGSFEKERYEYLKYLAMNNFKVTIFGYGWKKKNFFNQVNNLKIFNKEITGNKYVKYLNSAKITLGFLRKINNDEQNSRSMELAASGCFFLNEYSKTHKRIYGKISDKILFKNKEDLLKKIKFFMKNPVIRNKIALIIQKKIIKDKQDFSSKIKYIFN
jgi:spore maturation protein CgeB